MKRKVFNVFCFVIIFCQLFFCCTNTAKSSTLVHGTAKFKDNIVTLQLFNDNDSDVYVFDSYFKEGLSNSKRFYRWDKKNNRLKLSYVPIALYLSRQFSCLVRFPSIKNKDINDSSRENIRATLTFDTIPAHGSKKFYLVTQNFRHIKNVLIDDYDNISLQNIVYSKCSHFARIIQGNKSNWYIELAIYSSLQYLDIRDTSNIGKTYIHAYDGFMPLLIQFTPLLIKIDFE